MSPRTLPAAVLMPEYEALLRDGAELPLVISGESMLPFLRPGRDTVYLKQPDAPLQRGEIAFYRRLDGSYILHRVYRAVPGAYWFLGDAQTRVEGPLPAQCVFARKYPGIIFCARSPGRPFSFLPARQRRNSTAS